MTPTRSPFKPQQSTPQRAPKRTRRNLFLLFFASMVFTLIGMLLVYGLYLKDLEPFASPKVEKKPVVTDESAMDGDDGSEVNSWMQEDGGNGPAELNVPGDGGGPTVSPTEIPVSTPVGATSGTSKTIKKPEPPVANFDELDEPITTMEAERRASLNRPKPKPVKKPSGTDIPDIRGN